MATKGYSEMTAEELQALLNDPSRMRILWRSTVAEETRTILDDFSQAVARAFSPYCGRLMAFNRGRPAPGGRLTITINGGSYTHLCQVFQAMVDYCNGDKRIASFGDRPFFNSAKLVGAAKHLEMDSWEQNIKRNIDNLRKTIPIPEDTKLVLQTFDRHHPARAGLIDTLANAIVDGRLDESKEALVALRANDSGFDNALTQAIHPTRARAVEAKARDHMKKLEEQAKRDREWPALGK